MFLAVLILILLGVGRVSRLRGRMRMIDLLKI